MLPPELWLHIFSCLDSGEDKLTLASLCCVSKTVFTLCQPLLFHSVSVSQFQHKSFEDALRHDEYGHERGKLIRRVALESYLGDTEEAPGDCEQEGMRDMECLQLCPSVLELSYDFGNYAQDDGDYNFIPTATALLALPLVKSLRHLCLSSPEAPGIDLETFGHLIIAAHQLSKLSLTLVDATQLLTPVLRRFQSDPNYESQLCHLIWDETAYSGACSCETYLYLWSRIPSFKTFHYSGPYVHFRGIAGVPSPQLLTWVNVTRLVFLQTGDTDDDATGALRNLANLFPALKQLDFTARSLSCLLPRKNALPQLAKFTIRYPSDLLNKDWADELLYRSRLLLIQDFAPGLQHLIIVVEEETIDDEDALGMVKEWLSRLEAFGLEYASPTFQIVTVEFGQRSQVYGRNQNGILSAQHRGIWKV